MMPILNTDKPLVKVDVSDCPISSDLLKKFDVPGPRYTSYPTADRFVEAFNEEAYIQALERKHAQGKALPLSIYVHIPFCESLCLYCACNKIITTKHSRSMEYLRYLSCEIDLHVKHLGRGHSISQLHLGGGSPTFFNDEELSMLMDLLKRNFEFMPNGEYSIEIDPRTVDTNRLKHLAELGFNRISFGVQDFDSKVQLAVNRIQPFDQVNQLVTAAYALNFESVNVDLIYGLPKQTVESFAQTLQQVTKIRPDRIALYAYAHLPERFKAQRAIHAEDLPDASIKVAMLAAAIAAFISAGYVYIGMDHFALPSDSIAIAKRQGRLHRNFQGYSTQSECDLIGLGVSSIGSVGANYSQNAKTLDEYYDLLNQGRFPVVRGLALNWDDLVRRAVIMALMCQGDLQYESIELTYMFNFNSYFADELNALESFKKSGMVEIDQSGIQVTSSGWFFVRAIAMVFDRYLQSDKNRTQFSKIL